MSGSQVDSIEDCPKTFAPFRKESTRNNTRGRGRGGRGAKMGHRGKKTDPLKKFGR